MNKHNNGCTRPEVNYNKLDARVKTNSSNVNRVGEALQSYASPNEYIITRFVDANGIEELLTEIRKFDFSLAEFNQLKNKTLTYIGVITDKGSDTPTQVLFTKTSFNIVDNCEEILFHNYSYDGSIINITLRNNITQILVSAQQYEYVDHNRIGNIEEDVAEHEEKIANLEDGLAQTNINLNNLTDRVNVNENNISGHGSHIASLQNRVAEAERQIDNITNGENVDMNIAIEVLKDRVEDIEEAYIKSVVYNVQNGIFTFTKQDGTIFEVDLAIEKVVANFKYNQSANALELTLADGTIQTVPMSDFAKAFEGVENEQIQVVVQSGNKIQAILKDSSVTYEKLSDDVKEKIAAGGSGGGTTGGGNVNFVQEEKVINTWNELPDSTPYTHQANVVLDNSIAISKSIELLNNDPVLFAKYGFAIGNIVGNSVNIYSVGLPTEAVTLIFELRYGGTINELLLQTLEGVC